MRIKKDEVQEEKLEKTNGQIEPVEEETKLFQAGPMTEEV